MAQLSIAESPGLATLRVIETTTGVPPLYDQGTDIGTRVRSIIMWAAKEDRHDIVQSLLDEHFVFVDGDTATDTLVEAAKYGSDNVLDVLLDAGVDPNVNSGAALMAAVTHGRTLTVWHLIDYQGTDATISGNMAIFRALYKNHVDIVSDMLIWYYEHKGVDKTIELLYAMMDQITATTNAAMMGVLTSFLDFVQDKNYGIDPSPPASAPSPQPSPPPSPPSPPPSPPRPTRSGRKRRRPDAFTMCGTCGNWHGSTGCTKKTSNGI